MCSCDANRNCHSVVRTTNNRVEPRAACMLHCIPEPKGPTHGHACRVTETEPRITGHRPLQPTMHTQIHSTQLQLQLQLLTQLHSATCHVPLLTLITRLAILIVVELELR